MVNRNALSGPIGLPTPKDEARALIKRMAADLSETGRAYEELGEREVARLAIDTAFHLNMAAATLQKEFDG